MRAVWNGVTLAETDDSVVVEGNHYFPPESVDWEHMEKSWMRSFCFWKGIARYYSARAGEERAANIAWTYRHPFPWVAKIRNHVAFWGEVEIGP
jgi:uncharacterized protein (DUF427 family)